MAKRADIGDITMSKDGSRMVLKIQAEEVSVKAYDGSTLTLKKGDYLEVKSYDECIENANFLLENDYMKQDNYDKRMSYFEMVKESFRARIGIREKKD